MPAPSSVARATLAIAIAATLGGCAAATLTPEQEWVMAKFADCKTRTNAINVNLDRVEPNGNWHASMAQTQTEFNRLAECMRSDEESAPLYRRMADAGNPLAMMTLGWLYEGGRSGLAPDDVEAVKWYRRGADAGSARAMTNLGTMYGRGRGGLTRDDAEALRWYRKGADAGDGYGMYLVGRAYERGVGVDVDRAEAVRWYRKAAAAGDKSAADRLKVIGE